MTFKNTYQICGFLAILIDEKKEPSEKLRTPDTAGPAYTNLFTNRTNIPKLGPRDFAIGKALSEEFYKIFAHKGNNPNTRRILNKADELRRAGKGMIIADQEINFEALAQIRDMD